MVRSVRWGGVGGLGMAWFLCEKFFLSEAWHGEVGLGLVSMAGFRLGWWWVWVVFCEVTMITWLKKYMRQMDVGNVERKGSSTAP